MDEAAESMLWLRAGCGRLGRAGGGIAMGDAGGERPAEDGRRTERTGRCACEGGVRKWALA